MNLKRSIGLLALTSLVIYNGYWVMQGAALFDIFKYWTFQTNLMVAVYCLSSYKNERLETNLSVYIGITMLGSILLFNDMAWWHKIFIFIDHILTPVLFIIYAKKVRISSTIFIYPLLYLMFYIYFKLDMYSFIKYFNTVFYI